MWNYSSFFFVRYLKYVRASNIVFDSLDSRHNSIKIHSCMMFMVNGEVFSLFPKEKEKKNREKKRLFNVFTVCEK